MPWSEQMQLGVADMDATHRQFVDLVDRLATAEDKVFAELFADLRLHAADHFASEKRLMKSCRFPATGEHESEHLRLLGELAMVASILRRGRMARAREYVAALPQWFATHLATMDAALAACVRKTAGP